MLSWAMQEFFAAIFFVVKMACGFDCPLARQVRRMRAVHESSTRPHSFQGYVAICSLTGEEDALNYGYVAIWCLTGEKGALSYGYVAIWCLTGEKVH